MANLRPRNVRSEIFAFRQGKSGPANYYWDGMLIKDRNVLMTGHLWLDTSIWIYNKFVSFQRGSQPVEPATSTMACQLTQGDCRAFACMLARSRDDAPKLGVMCGNGVNY